jgi:hypothetical protein
VPVSAAVVLDTAVSLAAVSVFAFSSFLQPTAKIATAKIAIKAVVSDFFMRSSPSVFQIFEI